MKSMLVLALGCCALLAAAGLRPPRVAGAALAGGPSTAPVDDPGVVQAARFAVDARQQAMKAAGKDDKIALVKVVRAQRQVVAGSNYILTLEVKAGDTVKTAEATVWVRLWLTPPDQYKLTAWKFTDEKEGKEGTEGKEGKPASDEAANPGPAPTPIKVQLKGPRGDPKLAGLKRFASQEELDNALGAGEATLPGEVDFAKEDVLCVGWMAGGSPRRLKWKSSETDGITFYVEEHPSKIHNNVAWVQADWFTVPKGTQARMGKPESGEKAETRQSRID